MKVVVDGDMQCWYEIPNSVLFPVAGDNVSSIDLDVQVFLHVLSN